MCYLILLNKQILKIDFTGCRKRRRRTDEEYEEDDKGE
jgi:hypothetical protein